MMSERFERLAALGGVLRSRLSCSGRRFVVFAVLVAVPTWVGCAATSRVTGDFEDYASYRRTRFATTYEQRLGASQRYLRNYPNGDYRDEVRAWFAPAEKHYFKLAWNSLPRLRAYLDAMPNGPHAGEVTDRIGELEMRSAFADRREERARSRALEIDAQLDAAAKGRRELLREVVALVQAMARTRSFGEPTSALDSELLLRFRLRQPPGKCVGDLCTKAILFSYGVPDHKILVDRSVTVTLEIALDRGLVKRVSLAGPELFERLAEAVDVNAVAEAPQARAEAIGHAVDVIVDALDEALPVSRCGHDAVSPTVIVRACDGVRFEAVSGLEPGSTDRLTISAENR